MDNEDTDLVSGRRLTCWAVGLSKEAGHRVPRAYASGLAPVRFSAAVVSQMWLAARGVTEMSFSPVFGDPLPRGERLG